MKKGRKALAHGPPANYKKVLRSLCGCGFCKVHDGENRRRRPRSDKHKDHGR